MNIFRPVPLLLLSAAFSFSSTLSVYQDQSVYSYTPKSTYLGFIQNIEARCEGEKSALLTMLSCPEEEKLCQDALNIEETKKRWHSIQYNGQVLDTMIKLPQPTRFDAESWISNAKRLGEEKAALLFEETKVKEALQTKEQAFAKKVSSNSAVQTEQLCMQTLEVTLPYNAVTFNSSYTADIQNDKEITVTQYLDIINRSGMDIEAQSAAFYYRNAKQHLGIQKFYPWIVSKKEIVPIRKKMKKSRAREEMADEVQLSMMTASAQRVRTPRASYVDAREYQIDSLQLPSTGLPLHVEVTSWKTALNCEMKVYPYNNSQLFKVCTFKPKQQIDSHRWKVKAGKKSINENAVGEYSEGSYALYTQKDEDVKVLRKRIVNKERETGIFGGTVRKKDGYTLQLSNKSDKEKTFSVIERIPASTTEEIEVKLLSVKSDKKVDYKSTKEGKIVMQIKLAPNESKKIEVLFEIAYDKELNIRY